MYKEWISKEEATKFLPDKVSPWISCAERLPDIGKVVLLYQTFPPETMFNCRADPLQRNFTKVGGRRYRGEFVLYEDQYADAELKHVSHWMPLPEKPNE